ncbi:M14 family zinc carboxypeptidase, partial [Streptomyces sp. NPDC002537]
MSAPHGPGPGYIGGYGKDARITRLLDRTELWFLISANPDGY